MTAATVAVALLVCGFIAATESASAQAPETARAASQTAQAPTIPEGAPNSEMQSRYVIGPGDTIQIFVWRSPELTVTVPVRPDGRISSPLVEDLPAAGKTPAQLKRDIEARLAEYIRSPQVSVIVTNAVSTFSQIKVIGQVKSPQALPYHEGMTALDAILAVGGLTDFASGNKSKIVRKDDNGKETSIKVRLEDVLVKGKLSENKPLLPGDVIVVPESFF